MRNIMDTSKLELTETIVNIRRVAKTSERRRRFLRQSEKRRKMQRKI